MKILYISNSIIPSRTANSIHVMKMCQAFADNGHEVTLVAPDNKKHYEKKVDDIFNFYGVRKNFEIKKLFISQIKGSFFYTISIFFFLIFNRKFDIVYGRFLHGCYLASIFKNFVVFEAHAPMFEEKLFSRRIFYKLIQSRYFKKLVVISESLKKMYLEQGNLNNDLIKVVHDGADEVKNFNKKADLLGDKKSLKVGYVGHLYVGKGLEVIDSIAEKVSSDIEFHIIGGTEKDIKIWREKIKSKNVYFYGYVAHEKVSNYLNALDVCLLPNQKVVLAHGSAAGSGINISGYTSPLKLFEYMSHKKAIISSNLSVLREVLNEKNSILVDYNNFDEWIKSINNLKNLSSREIIANQALSDFYAYTWKNRAKNIINSLAKKKITIFISSLSGGGAEGVSVNIANSFAKDGWKVDLVVLHLIDATYLDRVSKEVNVVILNRRNARYAAMPLLKYIRKSKPEIMFVFNYELTALLVILRILLRFDIKIITRNMNTLSRMYNVSKEKNFWIRVVVKFLIDKFYSKADFIVNQSHAMREDLISVNPQLEKKSNVIYNPLAKHIENYVESKNFYKLKKVKKNNYLLCVGRLEKQKGFHYAIEAFSKLSSKFPDLRLKIVGKGRLEKELKQNAIDYGVEDRVDFYGFQKNMIPFYLNARATVLTSLYEGYPNVLIESIALKTPVVAFDCPSGPSEIVQNGINGYLVKYEDVKNLESKLSLVLTKDIKINSENNISKHNKVSYVYNSYKKLIESFNRF